MNEQMPEKSIYMMAEKLGRLIPFKIICSISYIHTHISVPMKNVGWFLIFPKTKAEVLWEECR